jgi:putative SOS response-associated peptidase YedK
MCRRYYRKSNKQKIAEHFRVRNDLTGIVLPDADYNVAPTTIQPVIREARETKDRELILMRWGLVPFFTKALCPSFCVPATMTAGCHEKSLNSRP